MAELGAGGEADGEVGLCGHVGEDGLGEEVVLEGLEVGFYGVEGGCGERWLAVGGVWGVGGFEAEEECSAVLVCGDAELGFGVGEDVEAG